MTFMYFKISIQCLIYGALISLNYFIYSRFFLDYHFEGSDLKQKLLVNKLYKYI